MEPTGYSRRERGRELKGRVRPVGSQNVQRTMVSRAEIVLANRPGLSERDSDGLSRPSRRQGDGRSEKRHPRRNWTSGLSSPFSAGRQQCARHCPADVIEAVLAVQSRAGVQFADPEARVARLKDCNAGAEEFPLMGVGWAEIRAYRAVVPHICLVAVIVVHCICIWRCRSSPQQRHTPSTCTPPAQGAGRSRHNEP